MIKQLFYIVFFVGLLLGCVETDIVERYTPAQVEYLLSGGDIKTWFVSEMTVDGVKMPVSSCQDSVRWVFEVIDADSISSYQLIFDSNCILYDTIFFGEFSASDVGGRYTDTLKFNGGNKSFMYPDYIRGGSFAVRYTQNGQAINASLIETNSDILSRYVDYFLSGGNNPDDSREWFITSNSVDGVRQTINDCSDSVKFVFSRDAQNNLQLNQIVPIDSCRSLQTIYFGEASVPVNSPEGYFENQIILINGVTEEMKISTFTSNQFTATYKINTLDYQVTYKAN